MSDALPDRPGPRRRWLHDALFQVQLAAAAGLLAWLTAHQVWVWDWTANQRNSLATESVALLERMVHPLTMTSYAPDNRSLRTRIGRLLERYRRQRPDLVSIRFVDPELHPDQARRAGVELAGELVLEYGGRRERLQTLSEGHISNALQRLLGRPERWIGTLTGHGERSLSGSANHDLGRFGQALENRGYRVQSLDLAQTAVIPDNLGLLVVAGPQVNLLPGEVQNLRDYLAQGGNLLWLLEPDGLHGLDALSRDLGVDPLAGRIVDANVAELGVSDPTMALVSVYPDHPLTDGFHMMTLFPGAAALNSVSVNQWQAVAVLNTLSRSWNETGPIEGQVRRDAELGERAGPLTLGLAMERELAKPGGARSQRAVVIGDGDFLTNAFLDNAGNQALGLRLVRWLMAEDRLLLVPPRETGDRDLQLTTDLALVLGVGSLFGLPLGFLLTGLAIRWRRKRR
jgi:ABC-type uncharacterized transport system involved in gliding motility auxiliary subunit